MLKFPLWFVAIIILVAEQAELFLLILANKCFSLSVIAKRLRKEAEERQRSIQFKDLPKITKNPVKEPRIAQPSQ